MSADVENNIDYIQQIRSEFTNYEKLKHFYKYYLSEDKKLVDVINALLKDDIDIPTFHSRVAEIENKIDLNIQENKEKFIKDDILKLKKSMRFIHYKEKDLQRIAEYRLSSLLEGNEIKHKI